MNPTYSNHPHPHPDTPTSEPNRFAAWEHRRYAAPPGSVGEGYQGHHPYGAPAAPPTYGDGVAYHDHRGYPPQRPAHGDGVPYPQHRGQVQPQRPPHGDGVPYRNHRGYPPQRPHGDGIAYPHANQRAYPHPQQQAYPQQHQQPAHRIGHQPSPAAYPKATDHPPSSSSPKTGEVHIRNRVTSPRETKEKRTSWFLIGLTAFFLVWVFAAALFIFNQMNIL